MNENYAAPLLILQYKAGLAFSQHFSGVKLEFWQIYRRRMTQHPSQSKGAFLYVFNRYAIRKQITRYSGSPMNQQCIDDLAVI